MNFQHKETYFTSFTENLYRKWQHVFFGLLLHNIVAAVGVVVVMVAVVVVLSTILMFICNVFENAVSNSAYIAPNDKLLVNNACERRIKEAVVA
jgi:hypothetical protein